MNSEFKFKIYGIPKNQDEAVYEVKLPIITMELLFPIMGWSEEEDALYNYLLSSTQLAKIERIESLDFPRHLDLYIACYA